MTTIKTYPKMNEFIKDLLGWSERNFDEYTLARLVELEVESERLKDKNQIYKESLEMVADESASLYSFMDKQAPFADKSRILSDIEYIGNTIAAQTLSRKD